MLRHEGRLKEKGILGKKSNMHIPESEIRKANFTVLQNSSLVAPYMDEHMNIVRSENLGKPEPWITRHHIDNFAVWLRAKLMGDGMIADGPINDNHAVPRVRDKWIYILHKSPRQKEHKPK